jgi:hypothetical protein
MQRAWSFPMVAIAGFFWLIVETPATATSFGPSLCGKELISETQTLSSDYRVWSPSEAWRDQFPWVYRLSAPLILSSADGLFPLRDPTILAGGNGLLQMLNDDGADLYKRPNRRPEVRRKVRKLRTAWPAWLLGWCLDLVAVLAAAEISASIVIRAL